MNLKEVDGKALFKVGGIPIPNGVEVQSQEKVMFHGISHRRHIH